MLILVIHKKIHVIFFFFDSHPHDCLFFCLFIQVNTSGQFVGVAEMVGPVDFNKNVEYWQQDKWVGCFPVKWHIVKDVPNSLLKHITLENNENKPVTNSRDTQEVCHCFLILCERRVVFLGVVYSLSLLT